MIIRVRTSLGIWKVNVNGTDPAIQEIKEEIEKSQQVPVNQQLLVFNGQILDNSSTISSYNISRDDIIELDGRIEKTTVEKAYIDEDGVFISAGSKVAKVIPSGNYAVAPAAVEPEVPVALETACDSNIEKGTESKRVKLDNASDISANPIELLASSSAVADQKLPWPSYEDDLIASAALGDDGEGFGGGTELENNVRSPIASKRMVLVSDVDNEEQYEPQNDYEARFVSARQQHENNLNAIARKAINQEVCLGQIDESFVQALRDAGLNDSEIYSHIQHQKSVDKEKPIVQTKRLTGSQQRALDRMRAQSGSKPNEPAALMAPSSSEKSSAVAKSRTKEEQLPKSQNSDVQKRRDRLGIIAEPDGTKAAIQPRSKLATAGLHVSGVSAVPLPRSASKDGRKPDRSNSSSKVGSNSTTLAPDLDYINSFIAAPPPPNVRVASRSSNVSELQGEYDDDDALRIAMEMSLSDKPLVEAPAVSVASVRQQNFSRMDDLAQLREVELQMDALQSGMRHELATMDIDTDDIAAQLVAIEELESQFGLPASVVHAGPRPVVAAAVVPEDPAYWEDDEMLARALQESINYT